MANIIDLFKNNEYIELIKVFNKMTDKEFLFYYYKSLFILKKFDVILDELNNNNDFLKLDHEIIILIWKSIILTRNEEKFSNFINDIKKIENNQIHEILNLDKKINIENEISFEQNQEFFVVYLNNKEEYNVNILSDKILIMKNDLKKEFELFEEILPQLSYFKENTIFLKKKEKKIWRYISKVAKKDSPPSYPTSNKNNKNWDKVCNEFENEWEKNKDYDTDATTHFFKQIYENSNPEARRAMIKSFQTSNGKALSTNWNEVKEKDYEGKDKISDPDGMVEKKWNS